MAGRDTAPDTVHIRQVTPTSMAIWSGPLVRPASGLVKVEMDSNFQNPKIKAIWLSEKGQA